MVRHFCICFSLKTGAIMMSFLTLVLGASEIIIGVMGLSDPEGTRLTTRNTEGKLCNLTKVCNFTTSEGFLPTGQPGYEGNVTLFTVCLILGMLSVFSGVLLLIGIIQAKESYVLWYVLLGSVALFIVTIYAGINMFHYGGLAVIFIVSIFMCFGQISMYNFYEEVAEYNTVNAGVIEITYNGNAKSYYNSGISADDSVDNTVL